jgi:hypothetical protein
MLASSIPTKMPIQWGASAGGSYIRAIPQLSQISITPGAASFTDGFPPLNFLPVGSGGVPPFGQDMNGILNIISLWNRWQQAGGSVPYDATFQATIGGYPQGAVVASTVTLGLRWFSLVDNNTTNPDTGGAGWVTYGRITLSQNVTLYVNASTGSDSSGSGSVGSPWQTLAHARNVVLQNYDLAGQFTVTFNCTGAFAGFAFAGEFVGQQSAANEVWAFTNGSSVAGFGANANAQNTIQSVSGTVTFTGPVTSAIAARQFSSITIGSGIVFGTSVTATVECDSYSTITFAGGGTITGSAPSFGAVGPNGLIQFVNSAQTFTLSGSPVFASGFMNASGGGNIKLNSSVITWSGAAGATTPRFTVSQNAWIDTQGGGATYLPGTAAGTGANYS